MFKTFIVTTLTIAFANAIEPAKIELADGKVRDIVNKYINEIPDVDNQFVINGGLSKVISQYFKGRINMLPLYKINLKIDRMPIKIPWNLSGVDENDIITDKVSEKEINTIK